MSTGLNYEYEINILKERIAKLEKILSNEREGLGKHEQKNKCATDKFGEPISAYDLNKVGGFNKH